MFFYLTLKKVYLHGGQVVLWKNQRRQELLFMSSKAIVKPPKAVRGGIPICFPQFGHMGNLEQHGFARNRLWELVSSTSATSSKSHSSVDLILKSTEDDLKTWPRSEVRVEGLETLDYLYNLTDKKRFTEQADAITFDGKVDRVYLSTPSKIAVIDHERKRTLELRKEGLPDTGVWNPWNKEAKAIPDFGDGDYKSMLCLDSAVIETPIVLKPSEGWTGRQELPIVGSSYFSGQLDDPHKVILYA